MIFFEKTEKRFITREEMLLGERWCEEYCTSIIRDGSGTQEFISGTSEIQEKWNPCVLRICNESSQHVGIVDRVMAEVKKYVDSPVDLATIRDKVEKNAKTQEYMGNEYRMTWSDYADVAREIGWLLEDLHTEEFHRLVWDGSIVYKVSRINYIDSVVKLEVKSGLEMKAEAEKQPRNPYFDRKRLEINSSFRFDMLRFPETDIIVKLKESFEAIAGLLEVKTVFASDFRENPIHYMMGMCYNPGVVQARVGTGLVKAVQDFGYAFGKNKCYSALLELDKVWALQAETDKIKDQDVKNLVKEAINILNKNECMIKTYLDIWDAYVRGFLITGRGTNYFANPWRVYGNG